MLLHGDDDKFVVEPRITAELPPGAYRPFSVPHDLVPPRPFPVESPSPAIAAIQETAACCQPSGVMDGAETS